MKGGEVWAGLFLLLLYSLTLLHKGIFLKQFSFILTPNLIHICKFGTNEPVETIPASDLQTVKIRLAGAKKGLEEFATAADFRFERHNSEHSVTVEKRSDLSSLVAKVQEFIQVNYKIEPQVEYGGA